MMEYKEFLESKQIRSESCGISLETIENEKAFDWQKDIVKWALKKGKCALFEDCGLGKTIQQLMWANEIVKYENKPVLILCPLAVAKQTYNEGLKFGIPTKIVKNQSEVENIVCITNYEKIEHFDIDSFVGIVLDESSILKDYTSKTKQMLVDKCQNLKFKLCCTATPSPNDFVELGNHSEFLGIMSRTEMLATFFVHDGGNTSSWRLKGHAVDKFFEWVASWACCITSPVDLGYDGKGYDLPQLNLKEVIVESDKLENADGQMLLLPQDKLSLLERRQLRKETLYKRCLKAAEIANNIDSQVLVWCDLNDESKALKDNIIGAVEVKGADTDEHKTTSMNGFTTGNVRVLVSKPSIAGWGMNWQNCNNIIFVGLSDSFESYYQAVRRCYRFGQTKEVNVYIVISDGEGAVKDNIARKQANAVKMTKELVKHTKSILEHDIKATTRITETYIACDDMIIPDWIREDNNND